MQRGRGGRGGFFGFGDPFPGLGGFVPPGDLMSSFFGGTNPFDDPFFTNPASAMIRPSLFQQSMFRPSMFGPHIDLNGGVINSGGFQQLGPEPSRPKGPIIKELSSDNEDNAEVNKEDEKTKANPMKHPRIGKEPYVQDPEEEFQDNKRHKCEQFGREYVKAGTSYPQSQTFMFQSSTVTYGGANGACYTASTTRRSGGDGVTIEENKEADTTTGKATHRIARGIGSKGHAVTRKLNSDGKVNTMETLQNLHEDELSGFEESWQRNAGQYLPGWDPRYNMLSSAGTLRPGIREENGMFALPATSERFALPAPDQPRGPSSSRMKRRLLNDSSQGRPRS
ncbi:uncharacterized protein LOC100824297 isoform X1 [Brachypodium distachyon]|uniref:Myeloid leukemia factor n=1 Tax=Brachypodium distachyon TaxID=15368 RepID=A0A0Q3F5H4_BRADI|nr:uncharacterized protein LOC100824297 isoform X1 [Brachypodium distachyon]KQJ94887.1 hypothetical protein BRADI_3g13860v3 [Brachypodium distachyon]|eukprot:XP_024318097.1 uncharacterized protein LOC100824297 isoform X1 [Brachypodium distachyon]